MDFPWGYDDNIWVKLALEALRSIGCYLEAQGERGCHEGQSSRATNRVKSFTSLLLFLSFWGMAKWLAGNSNG